MCHVCVLFENADVADAVRDARSRAMPVSYMQLSGFLWSQGHRIRDYQLRDHFLRHEVKR